MTTKIPDDVLEQLSEVVVQYTGLHFPASRFAELQRGVIASAPDLGFPDPLKCAQWLLSSGLDKEHIEVLASHLTIGETYFFRDAGVFKILEEQILPDLVANRSSSHRRLKIWSAGCSTGEEPFSIAISLSRNIPELPSWQITLLGTDINPRSLKKAEDRTYSRWSFRHAPPWLNQYFEETETGGFVLNSEIKHLVNFFYLNLVEDLYPSLLNSTNAMDVIFCRNVLMYLAPEQAKMVIDKLSRCLVEGGWLFVAPCEASHWLFDQFTSERFDDTIVYRKRPAHLSVSVTTNLAASEKPAVNLESPIVFPPAITFNRPALPPRKTKEAGRRKKSMQPKSSVSPQFNFGTAPDGIKLEAPKSNPAQDGGTISDTNYSEALNLYEKGAYRDAADRLLADAGAGNTSVESLLLLARTFANLGDLEQALKWCQKSLAADKLNPSAHYLQATILQEEGATADATMSLTRALYLDPDFAMAHFALGKMAQRAEKFKDAKKHFQRALSCLQSYSREDIVPESGGITAGRLSEIIRLIVNEP